jgi:hypothetical protein
MGQKIRFSEAKLFVQRNDLLKKYTELQNSGSGSNSPKQLGKLSRTLEMRLAPDRLNPPLKHSLGRYWPKQATRRRKQANEKPRLGLAPDGASVYFYWGLRGEPPA